MKLNLLIGAVLLVSISSCSTAYRSGQTPDDLYYSPGRVQDEYVRVEKNDDRYYDGDEYYEDRYLRMRVQNRYQWSVLDDYYFNSPYSYNYYGGAFLGSSFNNPWSSYHMWNNYYNPYGGFYNGYGYYGGHGGYYGGGFGGGPIVIVSPRVTAPARPITFNPSSYGTSNPRQNTSNSYYNNSRNNSRNYYNSGNNNSRYNNNNSNRNSYNNGNSGRNSGYESQTRSTPDRSYNPPASNSSQSSGGSSRSSSGSSSGSTRPPR